MTGVVASLITDDDVEPLGEQIDNLAFAFIAPLGADDRDDHRTEIREQRSEIRSQRSGVRHTRGAAVSNNTKPRLHSLFDQATVAALTCLSSMREMACSDVAPTTRSSSLPFLKRIKVGIPFIP